jgi:hypothetical protein
VKKISFIPSSYEVELLIPPPKPAKIYLPDWYKSIKPINKKNPKIEGHLNRPEINLKMCVPFLDSLTSGYIQEIHTDIVINVEQINENEISVKTFYSDGPEAISWRPKPTLTKITDEYFPIEFTWFANWIPVAPKGYSILFTNPLNRLDLPFTSFSGIIDSDVFYHHPAGAYPFLLKKEFNNILIPAGTPIYQIIPIKRENWSSNIKKFDKDLSIKNKNLIRKHFYDGYKKYFWKKKSYN